MEVCSQGHLCFKTTSASVPASPFTGFVLLSVVLSSRQRNGSVSSLGWLKLESSDSPTAPGFCSLIYSSAAAPPVPGTQREAAGGWGLEEDAGFSTMDRASFLQAAMKPVLDPQPFPARVPLLLLQSALFHRGFNSLG